MLQWMGGSRRKVKTSRKSVQNRQHQYFQQRKRQQRTQVLEKNVDDSENISQNIQHSKSLDVASLMNICLAVPATSQPKFMSTTGLDFEPHLVQNASIKADTETQWTPSSATKAEEASSGTVGPFLPDCHAHCQLGKPEELKDQRSKANHPPKKLSLLDIISDHSIGGCQKRSPMEVYASFSMKGWKDENHEEGILSQKCNTSDFFTPPGGSRQENIYSINDRGIQENSHTFSWDGTSQTDGSFMEFSPMLANLSTMYDTRSRDSIFPNARYVIDEISNKFSGEGNSYWTPITLCKELESKERGCGFTREDIQLRSRDLLENLTLINKPHYNGVYKMTNPRSNVNCIATDLDCSSSSTFNPHFTTNFGTENGNDISGVNSSDESLTASIGNIDWLHDHPVERNCSPFHHKQQHLVEYVSLRTENDCGINFINEDVLKIKSCRTISPDLPNFCEIHEDTIPEQFDIATSKAMSGDSQASPYLEEVSVMPENLNASMMESHLQKQMKVTLDSMGTKLKNDKRAPMAPTPFNSRSSYDATFHSNIPTTSKPLRKKYKSSALGKTEPAIEGNKSICSPLYCLETEEKMKYLEMPQNRDQNKFIENQDNRIKLNTIHSRKNVKIPSSVDRDKIVIHDHEDSQRSTTQHSEGKSVESKQKTCNLQIESSHVNNQEDIQLTETQHHIDEVHLELEGAQTKERKTQEDYLFHENEHLTMCPKEQFNVKPKRMEDHKTQGYSEENYLHKRSRITISRFQETNSEEIKSQGNKSVMDNTAAMEYQGMLESYILQLQCMHKALQQTMDEELCNKRNNND